MAIEWSTWVGSGFGRARVGIDVSWAGLNWTARVYLTLGASTGDQVTLTRSGAWSGTTTFTHQDSSGSADTLIYTGTGTASAGQTLSFGVAMSGVWSGNNPSLAVSSTAPVNPPAAPTDVILTRVSDTSTKVDWSATSTTAAPIVSQRVLRREYGKTAVSVAASISNGTTRTFTDNTTEADRDYEYAVEAKNAAGTATSSWARIQTTPAAPTTVTAAKSGADIVVTIEAGTSISCAHAVEHSTDGGSSWSALGTIAAGLTTYTHTSPSGSSTHTYRVCAVTPTNALTSSWRQSNTVVLIAPPNAPADLAPNGTTCAFDEDCTFTWVHNPIDTTAQTQFQVRHRDIGGAWVEEAAVTSSVSSWVLAAEVYVTGSTVEWQVRTWGAHVDPSPWSATATVYMATRALVTINAPATSVDSASTVVEWTLFSPGSVAQSSFTVRLVHDGSTVETVSGSGNAASAALTTRLEDGETYTVFVDAVDANGLAAVAESVTFTVSYLPPAEVGLDAEFDEDTGRVYLTALPEDPVEAVSGAIERIDIQRSIDGGEWVTIIHGAPATVFTFDALPHTRGANTYRAVSYSPIGASAIGPTATVDVLTEYSYLNWGAGRGEVARLLVGQTFSEKSSRERALVQFASATLPTLLMGRAISRTLSVSAATVKDFTSSPVELHEASTGGTTVAWRDATGRRIDRGSLNAMSASSSWAPLSSVSFDITYVR